MATSKGDDLVLSIQIWHCLGQYDKNRRKTKSDNVLDMLKLYVAICVAHVCDSNPKVI